MLDFPASPTDGQLYNGSNGVTYQWISSPAMWVAQGAWTPPPPTVGRANTDVTSFGAVGDGVADDSNAIQNAINWAIALGTPAAVTFPAGNYRITAMITCFSANNLTLRGVEGASTITIDFTGAASVALKATNLSDPTIRGGQLTVDRMRFVMGSSTSGQVGPVVFEQLYSSGLTWSNNFISHYRSNTAMRLSGCWNCQLSGHNEIWGAGKSHIIASSVGVTFSITAAATTLTASVPWFTASMVGKAICLSNLELFVISAFTDAQTVTVSRAAFATATNLAASVATVTGSMTSGSSTLTLDDNLFTSADIGRVVYIPLAKTTTSGWAGALRATVTAVAGTTVTLDSAATVTASNVYVIASPAVEIFSNAPNETTNDLAMTDFHMEQFDGTGLVIDGGINIRCSQLKVHGRNNAGENLSSTFGIVFSNVTSFSAEGSDLEGTMTNQYGRIYAMGFWSGSTVRFTNTHTISLIGCKLAYLATSDVLGNIILENTSYSNTTNVIDQADPGTALGGRIRQIGGIGNGWSMAATVNNQTLNFASTALSLVHTPSGVIAANVGPAINFSVKTADRTQIGIGLIESVCSVVTPGSETSTMNFSTYSSAALARRMTLGSTGNLTVTGQFTNLNTTAIGAGSSAQSIAKASSTANFGIFYGTGDPSFSAAKGSLYTKTDATTTTTRLWVNTTGSTTWAFLTTSA